MYIRVHKDHPQWYAVMMNDHIIVWCNKQGLYIGPKHNAKGNHHAGQIFTNIFKRFSNEFSSIPVADVKGARRQSIPPGTIESANSRK